MSKFLFDIVDLAVSRLLIPGDGAAPEPVGSSSCGQGANLEDESPEEN